MEKINYKPVEGANKLSCNKCDKSIKTYQTIYFCAKCNLGYCKECIYNKKPKEIIKYNTFVISGGFEAEECIAQIKKMNTEIENSVRGIIILTKEEY